MNSRPLSTVGADKPLDDPRDDVLGYAPFARQIATTLMRNSPADGFVIALYGAWGTGKTTALNFIIRYMEEDTEADAPVVMRFNPWWFAGQEDLVNRFFIQFERVVFSKRAQLKKLKPAMAKFAAAVSTAPSASAKIGGTLISSLLQSGAVDVVELKEELGRELAREALRIVVVMDDVDRLVVEEVRQLFRLIKAVADFPNVTYLLAFDREVAARALDGVHEGRGDAYLEKIIQAPFELPLLDRTQLRTLLVTRIGQVIGEIPDSQFDEVYWGNVLLEGIEPMIAKPRDIVRLVNALTVTYPAVRGEVNVVDFIALEALRVFSPPAYEVVRSNEQEFAGTMNRWRDDKEERARAAAFHESWLKEIGSLREPVQRLLVRLFPRIEAVWSNVNLGEGWALRWRRALRVCAPEHFAVYFRFSVPSGAISNAEFEATLAVAGDANGLAAILRQRANEKRPDGSTRASALLDRLNDYAQDNASSAPRYASTIIRALFEVGDDVVASDARPASPLDPSDELRVHFVIRNLLKLVAPADRLPLLKTAVSDGRALGVVVREVTRLAADLGKYGGDAVSDEDRLMSGVEVDELEAAAKSRLAGASADQSLLQVPQLLVTLSLWRRMGEAGQVDAWMKVATESDVGLANILTQFIGWGMRASLSDRVARRRAQVSLKSVETFFDLNVLIPRLRTLLARPEWTDAQHAAMKLIVEKFDKRASGARDPFEDFE